MRRQKENEYAEIFDNCIGYVFKLPVPNIDWDEKI